MEDKLGFLFVVVLINLMEFGALSAVGFTNAEIKVYSSLLQLGQSTSGKIIDKSGLQSSVVHAALRTLTLKGLVRFVKVGKNRSYKPADPKVILTILDEKRKSVESEVSNLLALKLNRVTEFDVEMVMGQRAIFTLLFNLVDSAAPRSEYLSFSLGTEHARDELVGFYKKLNTRRNKKHLIVKVLANFSTRGTFESNYSKELLRKANVRYTSFHFPQGIVLFLNRIILLNFVGDAAAVVITSDNISNQFKSFFNELYSSAEN